LSKVERPGLSRWCDVVRDGRQGMGCNEDSDGHLQAEVTEVEQKPVAEQPVPRAEDPHDSVDDACENKEPEPRRHEPPWRREHEEERYDDGCIKDNPQAQGGGRASQADRMAMGAALHGTSLLGAGPSSWKLRIPSSHRAKPRRARRPAAG